MNNSSNDDSIIQTVCHCIVQGDPKLLPPLHKQNGVALGQIDVHSL